MNNKVKFDKLEAELKASELIYEPSVACLFGVLENNYNQNKNQAIFNSLYNRLSAVLNDNKYTAKREPDFFKPYAPEVFCNDGDIHVSTQPDGIEYNIDVNALLRCSLVLGSQGSGKNRLLMTLLIQIKTLYPAIKICVIDFKNGFRNLHQKINAKAINLEDLSLTLDPPSDMSQEAFLYELTSQIAESTGIIYGVDLINTAAERALEKANELKNITKADVSLCLKDILDELGQIQTKSYRIGGYLDAAKTALSFLIGKSALFSCRKGLSIKDIVKHNCIINCRSLTHDTQARWLVTLLLYFLFQEAKNDEESRTLKRIIVVDDANRVLQKQKMGNTISSLGNILSLLRATGTALIAASQLPSLISQDILSLSKCMFTVGSINGSEHLKVIQNFMGLTYDQTNQLTQFKNRQSLTYISGSSYSKPIHGFVPFVEDFPITPQHYEDYSNLITPWQPLSKMIKEASTPTPVKEVAKETPKPNTTSDRLIYDCITYPYEKVRERVKRLGMSVRIYETSMNAAINEGYLERSSAGKSVFLIATPKAFTKYNIPSPYARSTSITHAFYTNLTAYTLKQMSNIQNVKTELPIGAKGQTIDVVCTDSDGKMMAIEFTQSTSNLLANASKLQDTAYSTIMWLCKDAATANSVKAYFNKNTSLSESFKSKFKFVNIANFMKGKF